MKYLFVISVFFLFSACASEQIVSDSGKEYKISKDLSVFLNQFEYSVVSHNKEELLKLIDKPYIKKHYSGLKGHDKDYFYQVFFCGKDLKTGMTVCPEFNEIDRISFISIQNDSELKYTIKYIIYTIYEELSAEWVITVKKNNEQKFFGIKTTFD